MRNLAAPILWAIIALNPDWSQAESGTPGYPQAPSANSARAIDRQWPELSRLRWDNGEESIPSVERLPWPAPVATEPSPFSSQLPEPLWDDAETAPVRPSLWADLWQDQLNYYSWQSLQPSLFAFGMGAILANTQIDQNFRDEWQEDVHTKQLHSVALGIRNLGEGAYVIPAALGVWLGGSLLGDMPGARGIATWGAHTSRSILVGFPMLLLMQEVTGGSRPSDSNEFAHPSHWKFFQDNNGVSGHTFMGAIPFLTAAGLVENPAARGALILGSTLVGFSRIETDSHYLSQVMLGWWMAFIATNAVQQTAFANDRFSVTPLMMPAGMGLGFTYRH